MRIAQVVKWKLRAIMADRKITAIDLAQRVDMHANTINKWRKMDEMPRVSGPEIDRICSVLGCTVLDLIGEGKIQ